MFVRLILLSFVLPPLAHGGTFDSLHGYMNRFHRSDCALSSDRVVSLARVRALFEKAKEQQEESRIAQNGESVCSVENVLYSPTMAGAGLVALGSYYGPALRVKMSEKRDPITQDDSIVLNTRENGFCLDEKSDGSVSLSQSVDVVGEVEHWDNEKEMRNLKINMLAEFNPDGTLESFFYLVSYLSKSQVSDQYDSFSCGKSKRSFLDNFRR